METGATLVLALALPLRRHFWYPSQVPRALLPATAEAAVNSSHLQLPQRTALGACSCLTHWFHSKEGAKQINGLRSKGQKRSQISAPVCSHGTEWLQKKNRVEMGTWPGYLTSTASVEKSRTNQS